MAARLPRTMGLLTAVAETEIDGRRAFICDCRCGRSQRTVLAQSFDRGSVTCCELCVADGVRPNLHQHNPVRVMVSVDEEVVEGLGLGDSPSGALLRILLNEYASLAGTAESELSLSDDELERLRGVVRKRPDLLRLDRIGLLVEASSVRSLTVLECVGLLAKLRREVVNDD